MSEVIFKTLTIRNFMSFGNIDQVIKLDQIGTTLIIGKNIDEGGSSGAGKSTLNAALSYVLFDKIPSGVSKEKLINRFNESTKTLMQVTLDFTAGSFEWKLQRSRGALSDVRIWQNGKDVTPSSIKILNAKIEAILGFSYNIFSQVVMFNGNSMAFLDLPISEQRELIEEIIKITMLTRKAEVLKLQIKDTESQTKIQLALIKQQETLNAQLATKVEQASTRVEQWERQHIIDQATLKASLASAQALKLPCSEAELVELANLKTEIRAFNEDARDLERELALATKKNAQLALEHKHLNDATCPYCLQAFLSEAKLTDVTDAMQREQAKVTTLEPDINALRARLVPLKAREAELSALVDPIEHQRIKTLIAGIPLLEEKLLNKQEAINPYVSALEALASSTVTTIDRQQVDELKTLAAHQSMLLKLLTDKNSYIRKGLISKTLPFLNKRIAFYTVKLGLPHVVLFQPDMSCQITQCGRELDHGNLSNGEKKRLNLSLCLAFRDALSFLHSKVNLLLTDELDGGSLDEQGVTNMILLLKHKAHDDKLGIFVISHRPEFEGQCDRQLIVKKEGGFSALSES